MTRKEEIEKAAEEWTIEHGAKAQYQISLDCIQEVAFEAGATWSDEHPIEPILELIHQRSIAFDEVKIASNKLAIAMEALEHIKIEALGGIRSDLFTVAEIALTKIE